MLVVLTARSGAAGEPGLEAFLERLHQAPPAQEAFPADANEGPEIGGIYAAARAGIVAGEWDEARSLLEDAVARFPESRHLHAQLAELLWYEYKDRTPDPALLEAVVAHAARATEIGLGFGEVNAALTDLLARALALTKDRPTLERIFPELLRRSPTAAAWSSYASVLAALGDPRAEGAFSTSLGLEPEGNAAAYAYAEWLLDQGREHEVLELLAADSRVPYAHFLRGVAYERLELVDEAAEEYARYGRASALYPAPERFAIPGSELQSGAGIPFRTSRRPAAEEKRRRRLVPVSAAITTNQAIQGLSYLLWGEARGESRGGKRAEGYVVRNRVLRGTVLNSSSLGCPTVTNSGATLADQYKSVMCQTSQFDGVCAAWCADPNTTACSQDAETSLAASDVYNGIAPDPAAPHCPRGINVWGGSYCASSTTCQGSTVTYRVRGSVFNLGTVGTCATHFCAPTSLGKVCGNGDPDNCFYATPLFGVGSKYVNYTSSLSGTGVAFLSSQFSAVAGVHKGHLEGPENTANPDFDLYLQLFNSSTGTWTNVASSLRIASVEDISYSGAAGTYRWRVVSFSGSGSFTLYTKRP